MPKSKAGEEMVRVDRKCEGQRREVEKGMVLNE